MSADRQITLTESDDGHWTARQEPDGPTASGETPAGALDALAETEPSPDTEAGGEADGDPFEALIQATEDIHLSEDDLDAMIADSKDAWSSVE